MFKMVSSGDERLLQRVKEDGLSIFVIRRKINYCNVTAPTLLITTQPSLP